MAKSASTQALKRLGTETIYYGIGLGLVQVSSFLLLPLLTHVLSKTDYGVVSVGTTTGTLLSTVAAAGMAAALLRSYYDKSDVGGRRTVVSTSLVLAAGVSFALVILSATSGRKLAFLLFGNAGLAYFVVVIAAEAGLRAVASIIQSVLRADHRPVGFVLVSLAMLLVRVLGAWFLMSWLGWGLRGYAVAAVLGAAAGLVFGMTLVYDRIGLEFSRCEARLLIGYGIPLVVANLASTLLYGVDRYFLRAWHGLETVAVYNAGYQLASVVNLLLVTPVSMAWPVVLLPLKDSPDVSEFISRSLTLVTALLGWVVVSLAFAGPLMLDLLAPSGYREAASIIPIVALANGMVLLQRILAAGSELSRKMWGFAAPYVVAATVVLLLDWAVIRRWGMHGAAFATLCAYATLPIIGYIVGRSVLPVRYDLSRLSGLVVLTAALTLIGSRVGLAVERLDERVVLAGIGVIAFPLGAVGLRLVEPRTVSTVLQRVSSWLGDKVRFRRLRR